MTHPSIILIFHCSGLSSHQWRKLKNNLDPSIRILFQPSITPSANIQGLSSAFVEAAGGPLCFFSLSSCSLYKTIQQLKTLFLCIKKTDLNLILLYGRLESTWINHIDVEKIIELDLDRDLFLPINSPITYLIFLLHQSSYQMIRALNAVIEPSSEQSRSLLKKT